MSLRQPIVDSPPPTLEWRSNDNSTRVSMPIGLADRIAGYVNEAHKSVPRRGAEAGGILLGGVRLGPVIDIFITGFEAVRSDYIHGPSFLMSDAVQSEFKTAIGRYPAAEILGFYRSHTRPGDGLENSDQEIVDHIFPGLSGLVLLIKPNGAGRFTASYYFFQNGRLETRAVGPEFPFLTTAPGGTPPPLDEEAAPEEPPLPAPQRPAPSFRELVQDSLDLAPEPPPRRPDPGPVVAAPAKLEKRRKRLQWELVASGLMIAAALALLWWQYRGASGDDTASAQPAHVVNLGLAVKTGQGGWRISWDPNSTAAHDAVRGVLNITEDEARESIPLTAAQVRAGAATYRPTGDDITFRLELFASDSTAATESYRILMKPPEIAKAAPAPKTERPVAKEAPKREAPPKSQANPETRNEPATDAGYVEPEVLRRVSPEIPEGIRPRITAPLAIDVKVSIDREGHVTRASAVQHEDGLVDFLGKRAVAAAHQWTFTPARRNGKTVDSSRTIHFVFEQ